MNARGLAGSGRGLSVFEVTDPAGLPAIYGESCYRGLRGLGVKELKGSYVRTRITRGRARTGNFHKPQTPSTPLVTFD